MKKITFIFIAFALFLNACGPSIEGETKDWEKNLAAVEQAKKDYPSFASIIDSKLEEAKKLWEEAKSLTDEEAKAKKMSEANDLLTTECVGNLVSMKEQLKEVQAKLEEVQSLRRGKEGESKIYAEDAILDAEKVIASAKEALGGSSCDDVTSAYAKLGTTVTDLTTAITKLTAGDTQTKDSAKVNSSNNTSTTPEVKMVTCTYCDSKNESTNDKCKNCGAAIK